MVVGPEEVGNVALNEKEKELANKLIEWIDEELRSCVPEYEYCTIDIDLLRKENDKKIVQRGTYTGTYTEVHISEKIKRYIDKAYKEAGWPRVQWMHNSVTFYKQGEKEE